MMTKQQLINYFIDLLNHLKIKTSPDYIFYLYNDKLYIKYNKKTTIIWLDYDKIWLVFGNNYSSDYMEIREITTDLVEEYLKLRGITTPAEL